MKSSMDIDYQETRTQAAEDQSPSIPAERQESAGPLFPGNESESFRSRWQTIQEEFVDEPRRAVEQADELVSQAVARLSETLAGERERMGREWPKGENVSTEDLRQAFRRYRTLFDRLLAV